MSKITVNTIDVTSVDYHRNGISGEGFYVCHFNDPDNGKMMAVVFPPDEIEDGLNAGEPNWDIGFHNPRIAVFQESQLPNTEFGQNSWRGDNYARPLYAAIKESDS